MKLSARNVYIYSGSNSLSNYKGITSGIFSSAINLIAKDPLNTYYINPIHSLIKLSETIPQIAQAKRPYQIYQSRNIAIKRSFPVKMARGNIL